MSHAFEKRAGSTEVMPDTCREDMGIAILAGEGILRRAHEAAQRIAEEVARITRTERVVGPADRETDRMPDTPTPTGGRPRLGKSPRPE